MASRGDHRLEKELMDLVRARTAARAPREQVAPRPSRRILDIVLWSSVTNVALLACFVAGWNYDAIKSYATGAPAVVAAVTGSDTPAANARPELQDNELLTRGLQRQLKGSLQLTLVQSSVPESEDEAPPVELAAAEPEAPEQDQGDGTGDITVGPEDPAAQLVKSPVLRKSATKGNVEIGSFTTVSLPGSSGECLETAYGLLDDAGASRDKLKVLAESSAITVARICASNGSLVVTCRMDQITISPRRLKPNESCTG